MARHKHADLIHAWAEGAQIQFKDYNDEWIDCDDGSESPEWSKKLEYRIKPKEPEYEWQWIYQEQYRDKYYLTNGHYKSMEEVKGKLIYKVIEKYEPSKRAVKNVL